MRLVLDSSVVISSVQPSEAAYNDARDFLDALRVAQAAGTVTAFAPAELWLEVHVVEQRLASARRGATANGGAMSGLLVELVSPADASEITGFLELLDRRMRGRRPFANGTDLTYLWAASRVQASVVTLDRGMLRYHGVVCDVTMPQHVRLG